MNDNDGILEQLAGMLSSAPGDETEAVLVSSAVGLTRFAGSRIHQNTVTRDTEIFFRLVRDRRVGIARTNDRSPDGLAACLERAGSIAAVREPDTNFPGLPDPPADGAGADGAEPEATGETAAPVPLPDPDQRGAAAAVMIEALRDSGLEAAGSVSTFGWEVAVLNSRGVFVRQPMLHVDAVLIAMNGGDQDASGYACWSGPGFDGMEPESLAESAARKCLAGRKRVEVRPGPLDVLLEPPAVAGLLLWIGYIGFGAKQYHEGTSFMSSRLGERIMGENITIRDDHRETPGLGFAFDFEGVPRQPVTLVDGGRAAGVVHDTRTAAEAGVASTGHASLPDYERGPVPLNLSIEPGDASVEEMSAMLDRGLVVTRFHYINGFLDPRRVLFTGMTRDGTFLVEGGREVGAVDNFRFTESMLDAFSRVEAVGRRRQIVGTWGVTKISCAVPALLIREFTFTG